MLCMAVKLNKTKKKKIKEKIKKTKSVTEIAERLSVTRQTVYNYIEPEKNRVKISERNKKDYAKWVGDKYALPKM